MATNLMIDFAIKRHSRMYFLETVIIQLIGTGVNRVSERGLKNHEIGIFRLLVIFSHERIAQALAKLSNNDLIVLDYQENTVYYTPLFKRFLKVMKDPALSLTTDEVDEVNGLISYFPYKRAIMDNIDPGVDYTPLLNHLDLIIHSKKAVTRNESKESL